MNSKEKLSLALMESGAPAYMIERAENGHYSDYESDLETPIVTLVVHCRELGLHDIAKRAVNGDFDATKEESDDWYQKEGKSLIEEMGFDPKKGGFE